MLILSLLLECGPHWGGGMGMAITRALIGLGPPTPTKKLVHWVELLSQPHTQNHAFEIFRGGVWPPPIVIRNKLK